MLAGVLEEGIDHSFFGISIGLSYDGLNNITEIIKIVYAYINLLKEHGVEEWVFEEDKKLNEIKFKFLEESQPANYCCILSGAMQIYPKERVLAGSF